MSHPFLRFQSKVERKLNLFFPSIGNGGTSSEYPEKSCGPGILNNFPGLTPAWAKVLRLKSVGTQISSISLHLATHSSGMRSVSNIVRPILSRAEGFLWKCGGNICMIFIKADDTGVLVRTCILLAVS